MSDGVQRGRLADTAAAPPVGETTHRLSSTGGVVIEQILSGHLAESVSYDQDHAEWVAVLHGSAELEVAGEVLTMTAGDWILLPAHTSHRLLRTAPHTSWLAVHLPPG